MMKGDNMVKKLDDFREKILDVASILFRENEYKDVDMRRIAKEAGSAVGTIYNYFPNKEAIYVEIFNRSWDKTLDKLEQITILDKDPIEKIIEFILEIYRGKEDRRHLSKKILFHTLKKEESKRTIRNLKKKWHDQISSKMIRLLNENKEIRNFGFEDYYEELIISLIFSGIAVSDLNLDSEKFKKYIRKYVYKLLT